MISFRKIIVGLWLLGLALNASASVIQLNSFSDLPDNSEVEDFEDDTFLDGLALSSSGFVLGRVAATAASGGVTSSGLFGFATFGILVIDLTTPVTAFGVFFGNDDPRITNDASILLEIFDGATLLDSIIVAANLNDFVDQFVGFVSVVPASRVEVSFTSSSGANPGLATFVDDIAIGQADAAVIPSVGTILLSLLGLVILITIAPTLLPKLI